MSRLTIRMTRERAWHSRGNQLKRAPCGPTARHARSRAAVGGAGLGLQKGSVPEVEYESVKTGEGVSRSQPMQH